MQKRNMVRLSVAALFLVCTLTGAAARADAGYNDPVFKLDPVADSVLLGGGLLVAVTMESIISTGEIEAQLPDDEAELQAIDRWVADRDSASLRGAQTSDLGAAAALTWAVVDTTLAGFGQRPDSALTYATLYLESATFTWLICNVVKIGVRRPRPRAYIELREDGAVSEGTQESLSFYSLHTALTATLASTATYLAFTRPGPDWEPWVILAGSIVATAVVGGGRMLSGAHFTTDVLAGVGAGVATGVIVPHLHRTTDLHLASSVNGDGGTLGLSGRF